MTALPHRYDHLREVVDRLKLARPVVMKPLATRTRPIIKPHSLSLPRETLDLVRALSGFGGRLTHPQNSRRVANSNSIARLVTNTGGT